MECKSTNLDLIEERDGVISAYECKWQLNKRVHCPAAWRQAYPGSSYRVITRENYLDFVI